MDDLVHVVDCLNDTNVVSVDKDHFDHENLVVHNDQNNQDRSDQDRSDQDQIDLDRSDQDQIGLDQSDLDQSDLDQLLNPVERKICSVNSVLEMKVDNLVTTVGGGHLNEVLEVIVLYNDVVFNTEVIDVGFFIVIPEVTNDLNGSGGLPFNEPDILDLGLKEGIIVEISLIKAIDETGELLPVELQGFLTTTTLVSVDLDNLISLDVKDVNVAWVSDKPEETRTLVDLNVLHDILDGNNVDKATRISNKGGSVKVKPDG